MEIYKGRPSGNISGLMVYKPFDHILLTLPYANIDQVLDSTLTVKVTKGTKTQDVASDIPVHIMASAKGFIDGLGAYADGITEKVHILIAVARNGGLDCQNGSYAKIDLTGLNGSFYEDMTIDCLETKNIGRPIEYKMFNTTSDKQKFTNEGVEYIVLPKGNLSLIKLNYPNDGTPEYTARELIGKDMDGGEVGFVGTMPSADTANLASDPDSLFIVGNYKVDISLRSNTILDVDGVTSFEVQRITSTDYKFYGIDWK